MSNDPLRVPLHKVAELLRGLGLDPVDTDDIKSVHMEAGEIEVVRYRRDGAGNLVPTNDLAVATETVTIGLDG